MSNETETPQKAETPKVMIDLSMVRSYLETLVVHLEAIQQDMITNIAALNQAAEEATNKPTESAEGNENA